jgi:hypothetical protein
MAELMGIDNLRECMTSFYRENMSHLVTTEQFEAYLIKVSGISRITEYFERFIYGNNNMIR